MVHAWNLPVHAVPTLANAYAPFDEDARRIVDDALEQADTSGLPTVRGTVRQGSGGEVLVRLAEGADLVVGVCHTGRVTDEAIVAGRLVDILLSGHDHDLALRYDGQTVMVESSFDAHFVTAIDVTVTVTG